MWELKRNVFDESKQVLEESLFTVGNGFVGVRGAFEEGYALGDSIRGTYINGLYDRVPMVHAEMAYGFPTIQDKQPRIVDIQSINVWLDGEKVCVKPEYVLDYERVLDFKRGESRRSYRFKTSSGKIGDLKFSRLASLTHHNFFVFQVEVVFDGEILITSTLDSNVENYSAKGDPRVAGGHSKLMDLKEIGTEGDLGYVLMKTHGTEIEQATAMKHHIKSPYEVDFTQTTENQEVISTIRGQGHLTLDKVVALSDALRNDEPLTLVKSLLKTHADWDFHYFSKEQEAFLQAFWATSDILIEGHDQDQMAIRFMLFQLLQSTGKDGKSNVSAKGLSGEGYEGHYFWDTEAYVCPVMALNQHDTMKALLINRHSMLQAAKERAIELGHGKGAAYAWRTISGIECSGYFPAGTAQYHINADIAYATIQYYLVTGDEAFLADYGFEVLVETARTWLAIGHFDGEVFKIHDVTGPDEYTAIVNNNYYTNVLAKYHLAFVANLFKRYQGHAMFVQLGFNEEEAAQMRLASEKMCLPFDEARQLYAQDDSFLTKPIWPFEKLDPAKKPLLLHYHPLMIYRHQVLKQADTLLAHFLVEEGVSETVMKNAFDYYEPLTTHDSSLSSCIYGIMASRLSMHDKAYAFFKESVTLDLEDTHGNTKDGLHMANMAGSIMSVVSGFAGYRIQQSGISFRPSLPKSWKRYVFHVLYQNRNIEVSVSAFTKLRLISGDPIEVTVNDIRYHLSTAKPLVVTTGVIKGFVFDMDGVLTETSKAHFEAWRALASAHGFDLPDEVEDQVRGISRLASLDVVLKAGGLEKAFDHEEKINMANGKNDMYLELIKAYDTSNLNPGVKALLMSLKDQGFKIALASASKNAPFLLEAMGIDVYFDAVVDPSEVEHGKPAPDIFERACEMIGLQPDVCIGVEDAYAGIESIRAAGLHAVGIGSADLLTNCSDVFTDVEALGIYLGNLDIKNQKK